MQDRPTTDDLVTKVVHISELVDARMHQLHELEQLNDEKSDVIKDLQQRVELMTAALHWTLFAANIRGPQISQAIRTMDEQAVRANRNVLQLIHDFSAELVSVTAPLLNLPAHDHEDGQREVVS